MVVQFSPRYRKWYWISISHRHCKIPVSWPQLLLKVLATTGAVFYRKSSDLFFTDDNFRLIHSGSELESIQKIVSESWNLRFQYLLLISFSHFPISLQSQTHRSPRYTLSGSFWFRRRIWMMFDAYGHFIIKGKKNAGCGWYWMHQMLDEEEKGMDCDASVLWSLQKLCNIICQTCHIIIIVGREKRQQHNGSVPKPHASCHCYIGSILNVSEPHKWRIWIIFHSVKECVLPICVSLGWFDQHFLTLHQLLVLYQYIYIDLILYWSCHSAFSVTIAK